ncbi:hypothetical protein SPTER_12520 [Sporomusa termitida]|uniref:Uncharacterized protein n=2 Tax=Sporomusa termitida TaxID=2377 RepID=A0A517DRL1_9FIRM|nr:hypothetical protein SPTER_12520 [Sporomusa termitida]
MLTRTLTQAFDQYIFTRVDHILNRAGTNDAGYSKTAREVSAALDRLLVLARALKAEQPEMTGLVMDFEAWAALESGQAAEIAYRQGLKDSSQVRQELMTFLQQQDSRGRFETAEKVPLVLEYILYIVVQYNFILNIL